MIHTTLFPSLSLSRSATFRMHLNNIYSPTDSKKHFGFDNNKFKSIERRREKVLTLNAFRTFIAYLCALPNEHTQTILVISGLLKYVIHFCAPSYPNRKSHMWCWSPLLFGLRKFRRSVSRKHAQKSSLAHKRPLSDQSFSEHAFARARSCSLN